MIVPRRSAAARYLLCAAAFAGALLFAYAFRPPLFPGYVYGFLYVSAVFIAAWHGGFLPGVFACTGVMILVPYLFLPRFTLASVELGRAAFLITCSLLISWISNTRRRTESLLRAANEELEARVADRTRELSVAIESLQAEAQERDLLQTGAGGSGRVIR